MSWSLSEIVSFLSGAGFAVFVAVWFLLRTDRVLTELRDAVRELCGVLKNFLEEGCRYGRN